MAPPGPGGGGGRSDVELFARFDEVLRRRPPPPDEEEEEEEEVDEFAAAETLLPEVHDDWLPQQTLLPQCGAFRSHKQAAAWASWGDRWRELDAEVQAAEAACERLPAAPGGAEWQAELSACREEARDQSGAWGEALWRGLHLLRKRVAALGMDSNQEYPEQVRAVAHSVNAELDTFKLQQREDYDELLAAERELDGEASSELLELCSRAEAWLAEELPAAGAPAAGAPAAAAAAGRGRGECRRASEPAAEVDGPAGGTSSSSQQRRPTVGGGGACPSARSAAAAARDARDAEATALKEQLAALDAEVQAKGGQSGSWPNYQHLVFTRILRMFGGKATPACRARLQQSLPERSEAQIEEHLQWTAAHEARLSLRRDLLARWRERQGELSQETGEARARREAEEASRRRQAEGQERAARAEQRAKAAQWRQARNEEQERAQCQEVWMAQQQQRREEESRRDMQEQRRGPVEAFRSERGAARHEQALRAASAARAERALRRSLSQDDRQRIACRSIELLRRKWGPPAEAVGRTEGRQGKRAKLPPTRAPSSPCGGGGSSRRPSSARRGERQQRAASPLGRAGA